MKLLITGAFGNVGQIIINEAFSRGHEITVFEVKNKNGEFEHYPHFEKEIGECVLKSGSYVSVDALIDLMLWNIDTYIMTRHNRVVGFLKNVEDDSHVKTGRLAGIINLIPLPCIPPLGSID